VIALTGKWKNRVTRAKDLEEQYPAAQALLRFYGEVLQFQSQVAETVSQRADTSVPLLEQIDFHLACSHLPALFKVAEEHGPATVAEAARELQANTSRWYDILKAPCSALERFFAVACLQPLAEHLQMQFPVSTDESAIFCPACGSLPQVVILRPEGEGARRSLLCSLCLREWAFRRLLCPSCGETDKEKLPYYAADECKHVRVEACDTCLHYLKSVDLTLNGLADPLVDEVALSSLDVWATGRGYTKIVANVTGF
jgi:FdhE protein